MYLWWHRMESEFTALVTLRCLSQLMLIFNLVKCYLCCVCSSDNVLLLDMLGAVMSRALLSLMSVHHYCPTVMRWQCVLPHTWKSHSTWLWQWRWMRSVRRMNRRVGRCTEIIITIIIPLGHSSWYWHCLCIVSLKARVLDCSRLSLVSSVCLAQSCAMRQWLALA